MKSIATFSLKGGVGKTSIGVHLAAWLGHRLHGVLLLDADPQAAAMQWAEWSAAQGRELSFDVHEIHGIDSEYRFTRQFDRLTGGYDLVIVDLPPEIRTAAIYTAQIVDLLLIPATPSALDVRAAHVAVELGRAARSDRGGKLPMVSMVPSMIRHSRASRQLPDALADCGEPVAPAVRLRAAMQQASIDGGVARPSSDTGKDIEALAQHVAKRLGIKRSKQWQRN